MNVLDEAARLRVKIAEEMLGVEKKRMDITLFESATTPLEMREAFFTKMRAYDLQRAGIGVKLFEKGSAMLYVPDISLYNPTIAQRNESVLRCTEKVLSRPILCI